MASPAHCTTQAGSFFSGSVFFTISSNVLSARRIELAASRRNYKMDESLVHQILDEFVSSLEPLEAQNAALMQFLKDKGMATDEELAPYLEQAGNASNVRWRAFRVRTAALISSAMKPPETEKKVETQKDVKGQSEKARENEQEIGRPAPENGVKDNQETKQPEKTVAQPDPEAEDRGTEAKNQGEKDAA